MIVGYCVCICVCVCVCVARGLSACVTQIGDSSAACEIRCDVWGPEIIRDKNKSGVVKDIFHQGE